MPTRPAAERAVRTDGTTAFKEAIAKRGTRRSAFPEMSCILACRSLLREHETGRRLDPPHPIYAIAGTGLDQGRLRLSRVAHIALQADRMRGDAQLHSDGTPHAR